MRPGEQDHAWHYIRCPPKAYSPPGKGKTSLSSAINGETLSLSLSLSLECLVSHGLFFHLGKYTKVFECMCGAWNEERRLVLNKWSLRWGKYTFFFIWNMLIICCGWILVIFESPEIFVSCGTERLCFGQARPTEQGLARTHYQSCCARKGHPF